MGIGVSVFLLAAGGALAFAVADRLSGMVHTAVHEGRNIHDSTGLE